MPLVLGKDKRTVMAIVLPNKEQIQDAVAAVKRAHQHYGYSRPLKDDYVERLVWTAFFAIELKKDDADVDGQGTTP